MKTLMRNGRDRRSENPFLGHARKERVSLFGTDQRITSGPAATRLHSKAEYMPAPERFADSQIPLAPRAPSIHDPSATWLDFARHVMERASLFRLDAGKLDHLGQRSSATQIRKSSLYRFPASPKYDRYGL